MDRDLLRKDLIQAPAWIADFIRPLTESPKARGAVPWVQNHGYASDRRYATRGYGVRGARGLKSTAPGGR